MFHQNKRVSRRPIYVVLTLMLTILLAACGTSGSSEQNTTDNSKDTPATESVQTVREIQHAMGTSKIEGTPQRIVVLSNEGTEALLALGITPVGAVKSWNGDPWYDHIKDAMKDVTVVGDELQPNIEAIAALKPDLILGVKVRQEAVYDQLNAIAPTVFAETLTGDWKMNFSLYADAVNKKVEGEQALTAFDQKIEDAKKELGEKLSKQVSIVRFMPDKARIYLKDSFSGTILSQLGFARPSAQDKAEGLAEEVGKERIPDMDGDVMFYFVWEDDPVAKTGQKTAEQWKQEALWNNLNVVQAKQVYEVSDSIWNTAGGILAANLMLDELLKHFQTIQ